MATGTTAVSDVPRVVAGRAVRRPRSGVATGLGRLTDPLRILAGNRAMTWLVIAFAGVTIAEWGYVTALAVDAFRRQGAIAVGLVGFRLFFAAISSFFSISFVERHPGGRVLSIVAASRGVIVGASAAAAAVGAPLDVLLVLVALDAVASAPYRPAQSAMLPLLARTPKELAACAAGLSTVKTLSQALGATGGGYLMAVTTPGTVFFGAAAIFALAGLITLKFARRSRRVTPGSPTGIGAVLRDTVSVVRHPHVAGIVVVSGLRTFVRGMWIATAVIASLRLLHAGSTGVGLLMLASGIGSLAAVPLSASLIGRTKLGTPAAVALLACGIPLGLIAGVPVLDVALVLVSAWGIGMAVADVATLSLLHRLVDSSRLPRATAAIESAKLALEGCGALLAPAIVAAIDIRGALIVAGLPLPLVVAGGWKLLHRVDANASDRARILARLHGVPCLNPLDMAALESLASSVIPLDVAAGTPLITQGERGDRFYVVEDGVADVTVNGYYVGEVGPGGSFGEKALLRDVARTASVTARTPMELLALSREDFLSALTGQDAAPAERVLSPSVIGNDHGSRRERAEVLSRVSLFSHLDASAIADLAGRSAVDRFPVGAKLISRGDEGDRFYVMLDGRAEVSIEGEPVGELRAGDQFGEIALLHGVPRSADVVATSAVVTLSLARADFVPAIRTDILRG